MVNENTLTAKEVWTMINNENTLTAKEVWTMINNENDDIYMNMNHKEDISSNSNQILRTKKNSDYDDITLIDIPINDGLSKLLNENENKQKNQKYYYFRMIIYLSSIVVVNVIVSFVICHYIIYF